MNPVASVLMSVFNGGKYLSSSIESILSQTMGDFEFIIIDDGSTDNSWDIMRGYRDPRIKLHKNPQNIGLTRSLNKALEMARGEYIFRQDADDISAKSRFDEQINYLGQNPHVILMGSAVTLIDDSGNQTGELVFHPLSDKSIRWQILLHNSFFHSTVAIRRSALAENNLSYCTDIKYAQDFELWSRALRFGEGANLDIPLVSIRSHRDQISQKNWHNQQETATNIAMGNIEVVGLGNEFSREQIMLMRSLNLDWASMSEEERFEGGKSLRRLLAGFERKHLQNDHQWQKTRCIVLKQVHRCVFQVPSDWARLKTQWSILRMSPREAVTDLFVLQLKGVRSVLKGLFQLNRN